CALPGSNRRVTEFVSVEDTRRSGGAVRISYWLYRPGLGWERIVRTGGAAQIEAASHLRLSLEDDPALVPLETLPRRDHYDCPPRAERAWRWSISSRVGT